MNKTRQNILVIIAGFLILYWFTSLHIFLYISAAIGIPGLISEQAGQWILKYWFKMAEFIGGITSRILLTIVFFLVLCPVSFFYKLFSKDNLHLSQKSKWKSSIFIERNHSYGPDDFKNPW